MTELRTITLSEERARRLEWLLDHEPEIMEGLEIARDARSLGRITKLFWIVVLGLAALLGSIGGLSVLFRGKG